MGNSSQEAARSATPPSRRCRRWETIVVVAVSIGAATFSLSAVALSNVLPPGSQCHPTSNTTKSIDGRTYCFATVPWLFTGNYSEWGFAFQYRWGGATIFALLLSVTEPLNGTFYGEVVCYRACGHVASAFGVCDTTVAWGQETSCFPPETGAYVAWFIPDYQAGVEFSVPLQLPGTANLTLLVEA